MKLTTYVSMLPVMYIVQLGFICLEYAIHAKTSVKIDYSSAV